MNPPVFGGSICKHVQHLVRQRPGGGLLLLQSERFPVVGGGVLYQYVQISDEPFLRDPSDEGRVDHPVRLQQGQMRDGVDAQRLDEGPVLVLVAVDHDEVDLVPVLALDLVQGGGHVLAILAPENGRDLCEVGGTWGGGRAVTTRLSEWERV